MEINRDIARWVILIGALPIWWPFVKTLWRDFNGALREEGGLLGSPPTARELERLQAKDGDVDEGLESEPLVHARDVRRPKMRLSAPAPRRGGGQAPRRPSGPERPRGFR